MAVSLENALPRGTGPVATVYMTPSTGEQPSVIKVYPGPLDRPTTLDLLDEQRTLTGLRNVSSILLIDEIEELPDGRTAIGMALCARSLAELVEARGPLPAPEVVGLAETIAGVLANAHAAGVVHGGVTPTNVLYRLAGQPVLADFGLGPRQCFPRAPEATAAYTAPEVLRGAEPTEPADLYGLGAVLYLTLTGEAPFFPRPGEPAGEVLLRALGNKPAPLGQDLPVALGDLVTMLLAKDPVERPGSTEILDRLRELHTPVATGPAADPSAAGTAAPEAMPCPPEEPATPIQPTPPATLSPTPPTSPLPSAASVDSPGSPPQESAPLCQDNNRSQPSDNRRWMHPLLLAAPAVLAVLAVLLGVLGGGSDGPKPESATATDRDNPPSSESAVSDTGNGTGGGGQKDNGASGDEPDARGSEKPKTGEGENDKPNSAQPSTEPSAAPSPELEIRRVNDKGSTVDLTWRSSKPLTYAVFVAEQGGDSASANYRGTGTKLTVPVKPDLKYCFQVQGTDGTDTFQSPPRGIRGATCGS